MAFTTSGQETEWALFLQPRSPHGVGPCGQSYQLVVGSRHITTLMLHIHVKITLPVFKPAYLC